LEEYESSRQRKLRNSIPLEDLNLFEDFIVALHYEEDFTKANGMLSRFRSSSLRRDAEALLEAAREMDIIDVPRAKDLFKITDL